MDIDDRHERPQAMLSVDCEMMGLKHMRDRLCLVQICDQDKNVSLIQIEQEQQSAPNLQRLLEHTGICKIFHYGRADLVFLCYQLGILVNPVFCTKVASKLARTYTEKHGLRELVREFLNVDMNKYQQSSDWGKSNLSNDQIEYAESDVLYLVELKNILEKMLEREGKLKLAYRCFEMLPLLVQLDMLGYEYVFEHHPPK